MNKKALKYLIIIVLICNVWFFSSLTSVPVFENITAQAVSALWDGSVATSFAGGTGTGADPYLISNGAELAYFAQRVNSGNTFSGRHIKLTQDILLNEMNVDGTFVSSTPREFTCIGNNGGVTGNSGGFMGYFDGNSKRVTGLYINQPNLDNQGLFGFANDDSTIRRVGVSGSVTGRIDVAGVVGRTRGIVQMCYSICTVTGNTNVGGVSGNSDQHSIVKNCYNVGAITGITNVGGVTGNIDKKSVMVHNTYSSGTVTGTNNVGGVAGSNFGGTVWNNYYDNTKFSGGGISGGDVLPDDGAVGYPQISMQDPVIVGLLNSDNPDGEVWLLDTSGINDGYPILGEFMPLSLVSFKLAEGKHYTAATLISGAPLAVTADSAFTVGYTMRYAVSYNLTEQTIGLSNSGTAVRLPAGTSLIMLAEGSYYYLNLAAPASSLPLGDFIRMGSTTAHYAPATRAQPNDVKDFLFIFDFSRAAGQIAAGTYSVDFLAADSESPGPMPVVTVAGANTYSLTANGSTGSLNINLARTLVAGYDYKTDGKSYAFELALKQGGVNVPWPIGTKINGTALTSVQPYVFVAAAFGDNSISLDLSDCINPLEQGNYYLEVKAYACNDAASPREGYLLAGGSTTLTVTEPVQYAIKASAAARVFDKSASAIPVLFDIDTLGSGTVKSTLQRKYGTSYVNIAEQADLPVSMAGGGATLTVPAGYETGTYRFVLTLYDPDGHPRARAEESIIIK